MLMIPLKARVDYNIRRIALQKGPEVIYLVRSCKSARISKAGKRPTSSSAFSASIRLPLRKRLS
jgi:hypothetical protein